LSSNDLQKYRFDPSTGFFYSGGVKKTKKATKNPWETTDTACLLRHRHSRKYYGRFTVSGKQKWVNLDTTVLTVAKLRLPDEIKKVHRLRTIEPNVRSGCATMEDLMEVYLTRSRSNSDLKPSSIVSRETALKKLKKTWPGIELREPRDITPTAVQDWAARFKSEGTNFRPKRAKKVLKGNSATSVNRAIDALRRIMDIALERGQIHTNPVTVKSAEGRLKKKVLAKKLVLPSRDEAQRLIAAMKESAAHGGWGVEAAFMCEFMQMSGARIGEVRLTLWKHVHWSKKELYLPGYKSEASARHIPLFAELERSLKELVAWRKAVAAKRPDRKDFLGASEPIFRIRECQKSIDAACAVTGITRITHHDWRHLFATICIEAGVDIPTVSRWLGHSDGGVLAMKTYGHLRCEHSQLAAQKVKFGETPTPEVP
jgi:integrase